MVRLGTFTGTHGHYFVFEDDQGEKHFLRGQEVPGSEDLVPGATVTLQYRRTAFGMGWVKADADGRQLPAA